MAKIIILEKQKAMMMTMIMIPEPVRDYNNRVITRSNKKIKITFEYWKSDENIYLIKNMSDSRNFVNCLKVLFWKFRDRLMWAIFLMHTFSQIYEKNNEDCFQLFQDQAAIYLFKVAMETTKHCVKSDLHQQ